MLQHSSHELIGRTRIHSLRTVSFCLALCTQQNFMKEMLSPIMSCVTSCHLSTIHVLPVVLGPQVLGDTESLEGNTSSGK